MINRDIFYDILTINHCIFHDISNKSNETIKIINVK